MSNLFKNYKKSVEGFYSKKITWSALSEADKERADTNCFDYIIPYLSFFCFIAGSGIGAYALFA
jgi:hypothetical protein